jgi:hypothetical protein
MNFLAVFEFFMLVSITVSKIPKFLGQIIFIVPEFNSIVIYFFRRVTQIIGQINDILGMGTKQKELPTSNFLILKALFPLK